MRIHKKLSWRFFWFIVNPTAWRLSFLLGFPKKTDSVNLTLGMVTYVARFNVFRRSISRIARNFPKNQIIVMANGYYDKERQKSYLSELRKFTSRFGNIRLFTYEEPQSLSTLWNQIILRSDMESVLILNDDLDFSPFFSARLLESGILDSDISIINGSWSHFLITKRIVKEIGWFDERLYGVGGEDWDYEARVVMQNRHLGNVQLKGVLNKIILTEDFSYGKNIEINGKKYTKSSADFLYQKWQYADANDPDSKYVRIWGANVKLIEGMETPEFYPTTSL